MSTNQERINELLDLLSISENEQIKELQDEVGKLTRRNRELEVWYTNNKIKIEESEQWRDKYETVVNTPELKADIEAAFNRGHYAARQKMAAWFIDTGTNMLREEAPNE